ncbi:BatD family protein [Candidatus Margulisiibacteriota bacterium]
MKKRYFALLLALISIITVFAADLNFSATVDRTEVQLNSSFTYTLTISGSDINNVPQPQLPNLSGFSVLSSSQSSSFSWVNGKFSGSKSYKYILRPVTAGKHTIGPSVLNIKGQAYKTSPVTVVVSSSGSSSSGSSQKIPGNQGARVQNASQSNIFARIALSKRSPYVNEQVILTYSLYRRVEIWQITQRPDIQAKGFWKEDLPNTGIKTYRDINGVQYLVESFKVALFPMSAGNFTIPPVTMKYVSDFWDRRPKEVASLPLKVRVLPLPAKGKPAGFNQGVGQFALKAFVDKQTVAGDETLTLKVQVQGAGNIKTVKPPVLPDLSAFRRFDSGTQENIDKAGQLVKGSKTYTYVLVPKKSGSFTINPVSYSYFDPAARAYKTIKSKPISIRARNIPKTSKFTQSMPLTESLELRRPNIWLLLIKKYERSIYLSGLVLFPILLFILVLIKYRQRLKTDVKLYRLKRATGFARKRLKSAAKLLKEEHKEKFYAAVYKAVSDYIGDKFNVEAAGMTRDQILNLLSEKNASADIQKQVTDIFEACDYARFAPSKVHIDEMRKTYNNASELIIRIEREIK